LAFSELRYFSLLDFSTFWLFWHACVQQLKIYSIASELIGWADGDEIMRSPWSSCWMMLKEIFIMMVWVFQLEAWFCCITFWFIDRRISYFKAWMFFLQLEKTCSLIIFDSFFLTSHKLIIKKLVGWWEFNFQHPFVLLTEPNLSFPGVLAFFAWKHLLLSLCLWMSISPLFHWNKVLLGQIVWVKKIVSYFNLMLVWLITTLLFIRFPTSYVVCY